MTFSTLRRRSLVTAACTIAVALAYGDTTRPTATTTAPAVEAAPGSNLFARLPLAFERNDGQFDGRVRFAARGEGYEVALGRTGARLALVERGAAPREVGVRFLGGQAARTMRSTDGAPIVVERAMYSSLPGQAFAAGHNSAGVTAPATRWFLAEGATGTFFDLYVLIANPSSEAAEVDVEFLLTNGTVVLKHYRIGANSRDTMSVKRRGPAAPWRRALDHRHLRQRRTDRRRTGDVVESLGATPAQIVVERAQVPGCQRRQLGGGDQRARHQAAVDAC